MNDTDTLAAGLIAGFAHGQELRKLALEHLVEKLGGEGEIAKTLGQKALGVIKGLKPVGMAAVNAGVGATVGTMVGKSIAQGEHKKMAPADAEIATAAPGIFRAGYDEGLRRGDRKSVV